MSTTKQAELLTQLYQRLIGDAALVPFVGNRIYNHVPQQDINTAVRPLIVFRIAQSSMWGTKDELGYETQIQIDIWTDMRGDELALLIADELNLLLNNVPFVFVSGQNVLLQYAQTVSMTDPDGICHHTALLYRMLSGDS